jgi:RecB family exonuclease
VSAYAPLGKPLARLSPSSFETLRACPLRLAFVTRGDGAGFGSDDRQRIGNICHGVLESFVRTREFRSESWPEWLDSRFHELLALDVAARQARLRGWRLALARLRKVAARMAEFLRQAPFDAVVLAEQELTAADGRLYGRVDLIVRSPEMHVIVDYKTGSFHEPGTQQLKTSYQRQLMLYACLEAEASGAWPEKALLVPFGAEPVTLDVDPNACLQLLGEVVAALEQWQRWLGSPPPANPSAVTCGLCPFAAHCSAFWASCNPDWANELIAMRGPVSSATTTRLGGTTLLLDSASGSVLGKAAIRNVDPNEFAEFASIGIGQVIALVGLRRDPDEGAFTTRSGTRAELD